MKDSFDHDLFQGRKRSQVEFSHKVVNFGYYSILAIIIVFLFYEWLK